MNESSSRDTSVVLSLLLVGLFASGSLPWNGRHNAFHELGDHAGSAALALLHFGVPLVAAAITFSRLLRGRVPQRASFWMMVFPELLKAIAALLAVAALVFRAGEKEALIAAAGILLLLLLLGSALWKGKNREGWSRWVHLLAAMVPWHAFVAVALFLEQGRRQPLPGPWVYMFTAAAALPLMGWVLWPRKTQES